MGSSLLMQKVYQEIDLAAASGSPVITGETGTGKELAARAIHDLVQKKGPFIAVNMGALPKELVESELLGAKREPLRAPTRENEDASRWRRGEHCSWMS